MPEALPELTPENIARRIEKLHAALCAQGADWDVAIIVGRIDQYYFTGTMQDALFVLKRDGSYAHFVRKSFLRAQDECLIDNLFAMKSYREAAEFVGTAQTAYIDKEVATITVMERLQKAFGTSRFLPLDRTLQEVRAVKDEYELAQIRHAGKMHGKLLNDLVPSMLHEGMDEAELMARIYQEMISLGYQGVTRFHMFQSEVIMGQMGFGENSIYPTSFDGPGGMKGLSAAVPSMGDRSRKLKPGDLVFIDLGFGYNGYHSDRTQLYLFKDSLDAGLAEIHAGCMEVQRKAAAMLKPGVLASEVYNETVGKLDPAFRENFMGLGEEAVKFLGHGVGLCIDEYPVIAPQFDVALEKNMVVALEPKKSIPGFGILGVEDTYIVTENGGECISGGEKEVISVW